MQISEAMGLTSPIIPKIIKTIIELITLSLENLKVNWGKSPFESRYFSSSEKLSEVLINQKGRFHGGTKKHHEEHQLYTVDVEKRV